MASNAASTDHKPEFAEWSKADASFRRQEDSARMTFNSDQVWDKKHGINSSDSKKQHNNDERGIQDHV